MPVTTEVARPAAAPARPSRLGPFEIRGRIAGTAGASLVNLAVVGAEGTPFAGQEGTATCFSAPAEEAARTRLSSLLAGLLALDHPAVRPPLHADLGGNVAYTVEGIRPVVVDGDLLSPARVAELLVPINAALEMARRAGYSHGGLSCETVRLLDDGPVVSGWTIFGRGEAADQLGVAELAVEWLSGSRFPDLPAGDGPEPEQIRLERLRRHLEGTTERLVIVLANGTAPEAEARYPSVTDMVVAFQEAVCRSAEELVHGGFEAMSARSIDLARFLSLSAERYDPEAPGLDLLRVQLGVAAGGVAMPSASHAIPSFAAGDVPPLASPSTPSVMSGLPPSLTAGIPADLLAMIAPPIPAVTKPRNNPWVLMGIAVLGLILLLMAGAAVVVFAQSG